MKVRCANSGRHCSNQECCRPSLKDPRRLVGSGRTAGRASIGACGRSAMARCRCLQVPTSRRAKRMREPASASVILAHCRRESLALVAMLSGDTIAGRQPAERVVRGWVPEPGGKAAVSHAKTITARCQSPAVTCALRQCLSGWASR